MRLGVPGGWIRGLRALLAAVLLLLSCYPGIGQAKHPPVRHYLNGIHGWTRTTWYVPYSPPNRTASGIWPYWGTLAAPTWLPFGTRIHIPGLGVFSVQDRGGAVYGAHLDIFLDYPGQHPVKDYYAGVWY